MALRSRGWFLGQCYKEVRAVGRLSHLSNRALELGLSNADNTVGHILQACGAVQKFYDDYPGHRVTASHSSATEPYRLEGRALVDWVRFLRAKSGKYGQRSWGYDWDVLPRILTRRYGGQVTRGGGGNNEFEIVLRLLADFLT